jgi:glycosyltransferase involved in cell wall biosynthesis
MRALYEDYLGVVASGFTIAIPTHNRRETLLLAVRSALMQTRPPEHVIVLCDGCTDGSAQAVRELGDERVEALDLPKLPGYAYAHRNISLELARGEAIMWLGDDDLLLPDHLERLGEYWDSGAVDIVQSPAVVVWKDDSLTWVGLDWSIPGHVRTLLERNTNVMSSVLVRVASARAVGGWDADITRAGDWDLWKRLIASGAHPAMTLEPTVLHFRATERDQPWRERVEQNSRWFDRITDFGSLAEVRGELRPLRAQREAEWMGEIDSLSAELEQALMAVEQSGPQLEQARAEVERLREAERTLARVYAGGWWRLRGRLLPLMDRAKRVRRQKA